MTIASRLSPTAALAFTFLLACAPPQQALDGDELAVGASEQELSRSTYTKTRYPIVLAHGMSGFDSLLGIVDYWYALAPAIRQGGGKVYVTQVSAFNKSELRGEQLLAQVRRIVAESGAGKVNLIGHSHGGFDVRYVAAVAPHLVASVTTIGSPHKGADMADFLRGNISQGGLTESALGLLANHAGKILGMLSGQKRPQDAVAGLESLTRAGTAAFTAKFPNGVPSTACGNGRASVNGIRYWSWTGNKVATNVLDAIDATLLVSSLVYQGENDGLVGRCSAHFGTVIRDDYRQNHLDEVNQTLGLVSILGSSPKSIFRAHANRLKLAGL